MRSRSAATLLFISVAMDPFSTRAASWRPKLVYGRKINLRLAPRYELLPATGRFD